MRLDAAKASLKTKAITDAFDGIGLTDDTAMPRCRGNVEPVAWEYHVASQLMRCAKKRREKAQAAAVEAGVIFDHKAEPEAVDTNRQVYRGAVVEVTLAVSPGQDSFDIEGFVSGLLKAGVKPALIKRLTTKHTLAGNRIHTFRSSLVVAKSGAATPDA